MNHEPRTANLAKVAHESTVRSPIGAPTLRQGGRALVFTAGYIAAVVSLVVAALVTTSPSPFAIVVVTGSWVGAAVVVAVHVHLLRRDGLRGAALGFVRPTRRLLHLLWQVPFIIVVCVTVTAVVVGVLLQQASYRADAIDRVAASATWPTLVGLLLVLAVVTPLWEEVVFRGLLFSSLTRRVPISAAAVISSAVFAAVHVVPAVMPYLFLLGLGCCWLYVRHCTLWAPIVLHMVNNALLVLMTAVM